MESQPQENLSMIPVNAAQNQQSQQTQAGSIQTGADLLNTMTTQRLNSLYQSADKVNAEIMKVTGAAATPVPVTGTAAVNAPGQHQWQPIQNDTRPAYSRSGGNKMGMANAIRGVANIVGAFETKKTNEKNKALSVDIERLLEANQGMQSAQQAGDKATAQKNQDVMTAILSDDKKRKQIGKAFDINFVDPSQNNKPEHAALKQATDSYAQQLQKKLPTQMGPNVQAQQKLGQLQATGNLIDNQIKSLNPAETAYVRSLSEQAKLDEKAREANIKEQDFQQRQASHSQEFQQKLGAQLAIAQGNQRVRLSVTETQANAHLLGIDKTIQGRLKYAKSTGATDAQVARVIVSAKKAYSDEQAKLPTEMLQWQSTYQNPASSPQDKENAQYHINMINTKKEYLQQQQDELENQLTVLTGNLNLGDQNGSRTKYIPFDAAYCWRAIRHN